MVPKFSYLRPSVLNNKYGLCPFSKTKNCKSCRKQEENSKLLQTVRNEKVKETDHPRAATSSSIAPTPPSKFQVLILYHVVLLILFLIKSNLFLHLKYIFKQMFIIRFLFWLQDHFISSTPVIYKLGDPYSDKIQLNKLQEENSNNMTPFYTYRQKSQW